MSTEPASRADAASSVPTEGWDSERVREHWTNLAREHGVGLDATTKTSTIKRLEVDALRRALVALGWGPDSGGRILEVGCGNGHNLLELADAFPAAEFLGVDYVAEMVTAARALAADGDAAERLAFERADVRHMAATPALDGPFDAIVSVRCLINLAGVDEQERAIEELLARLRPGGALLLIENSLRTHGRQNDAREDLDLARRTPAAYNRFFDEERLLAFLGARVHELRTEDFASLHDLALYVLAPAINGGAVEYGHPLVEAATALSLRFAERDPEAFGAPGAFGAFGQNRLFVGRTAPRSDG